MRVLLADDHAAVRHLIAGLIRGIAGCEICGEASDGEEVVKLAEILQPEVVVLDQSMPKLSGLEAARLIKEKQPQIRIIILSMHMGSPFEQAAKVAGVGAWLMKLNITEGALRRALAVGSP